MVFISIGASRYRFTAYIAKMVCTIGAFADRGSANITIVIAVFIFAIFITFR